MATRPFLVLPGGDCVPLEGGEWYVLGHNSVVPCGSRRAASNMLETLRERSDVDRLATEAIEAMERGVTDLSGLDPDEGIEDAPLE